MSELPGQSLVDKGLSDITCGIRSEEALLVLIAAPRLRRIRPEFPSCSTPVDAELALYERLREKFPKDAYSRYRSLLRQMASYCRAAEADYGRQRRLGAGA